MAQQTVRLKCTGVTMNEMDKTVSAQFANEDPGSKAYSYLSIPAAPGSYTVGNVYTFTVESDGEGMMTNKDKMGLP